MTDGQLHKWGAKLLVSGAAKLATADACCVCTPETCNLCLDSQAPNCIELTLTGVARKSPQACRACDCVNGIVMELEYQGDTTCQWIGSVSVPCDCMGHDWTLQLVQEGGDYIWRLTGDGATFEVNKGVGDVDCMNVIETLTYQSQTSAANCDYSGASAAIAAKDATDPLEEGCISTQPEVGDANYESLIGSLYCEECGSDYPVNGLYIKLENFKCTPPPPWGQCCTDCESINQTYFLERCPEDGAFESTCNRFIYTFPSEMCGMQYLVCQFNIFLLGGVYQVVLGSSLCVTIGDDYCAGGALQTIATVFSLVLGEAPINCSSFTRTGRVNDGISWNGVVCGIGADKGDYTVWW